MAQRRTPDEIVGKVVVTKEGKRLGSVKDIIFEVKTGELIQIVLANPTQYGASLNLEQTENNELLIPWHAVIAIGDFIVINEEDVI